MKWLINRMDCKHLAVVAIIFGSSVLAGVVVGMIVYFILEYFL